MCNSLFENNVYGISVSYYSLKSDRINIGLQLNISILTYLTFHRVDYILWGLMTTYEHFNRFYKALVMEVHMILNGLYFFHNIFGEELWQRWQFLPARLVKHNNQAARLLQVLHFSSNHVLVSLDSNNWDAIVAHISDNLCDQLTQLVMSCALTTLWTFAQLSSLGRRRVTEFATLTFTLSTTVLQTFTAPFLTTTVVNRQTLGGIAPADLWFRLIFHAAWCIVFTAKLVKQCSSTALKCWYRILRLAHPVRRLQLSEVLLLQSLFFRALRASATCLHSSHLFLSCVCFC